MSINSTSTLYKKYFPMWRKCRDIISGEDAVKEAGSLYLPKPSGMDSEEYKSYKERAEFFNAAGRTLDGLHGMLFRKPVLIETDEKYKEYLDNVDGKGNSLSQFINFCAWDSLQTGFGGVLVDFPQNEKDEVSVLDADMKELSPYMSFYRAEDIINLQFGVVGRKQEIILVVLQETYEAENGDEYTRITKKRYRILKLIDGIYVQSLYDESLNEIYMAVPTMNGKPLNKIPFYPLPSTEPEKPMLLDLCNVNLAWYRKSADLENGAHWTGVPTPYCIGYEPETQYNKDGEEVAKDDIKLGGGTLLALPSGVTSVGYLTFGGSGLNILQSMMTEDENRLAILGARIISQEKKGVESAETAKIHRAGENSVLAAFAYNLSTVFTNLVSFYIKWCASMEENPDISLKINTDYDVASMSPAELTALVSLWQSGGISKSILFQNLKEGEIVPADVSLEDMEAEIQEQQSVNVSKTLQDMEE